jgi:predicted outer membrane protein
VWLVAGLALAPAAADELDARPTIVAPECLAPQNELDAVSLTIIDEKLALSLAVETHIQIELAQFALAGIRQEGLKHFTETKLRHYRQVFQTLEVLTGGRAGKVLSRATRKTEVMAASSDAAPTAGNSSLARRGRKGGIGSIVQNATDSAIQCVRLAIGQEYADLLRVELETALPEEFDRRYLSVESVNQMQVLAMLRVFEQQASPEFARIIHLATVAAESHASEGRQAIEQFRSPPQAPPVSPGEVVNTALEKS